MSVDKLHLIKNLIDEFVSNFETFQNKELSGYYQGCTFSQFSPVDFDSMNLITENLEKRRLEKIEFIKSLNNKDVKIEKKCEEKNNVIGCDESKFSQNFSPINDEKIYYQQMFYNIDESIPE